jgi:hypothetical protein
VTIPSGPYEFTDASVAYTLGAQRRVSGRLSAQYGHFYSGDIKGVGYSAARIAVTSRFSLEPGISTSWVDLPQGSFVNSVLLTRASYSFTPWMFVSGLFQYSSSTDALSTNLRFRWEYQPGSEIFFVYTDEHGTVGPRVPFLRNRAFVIKVNRLLRI